MGAAYWVKWQDKQVLITGRIPIKTNRLSEEKFYQSISAKQLSPSQYHQDLEALKRFRPDLWLPLVPTDGQNANLYDRDWPEILKLNERLLETVDPK